LLPPALSFSFFSLLNAHPASRFHEQYLLTEHYIVNLERLVNSQIDNRINPG
jgi:hypothetical protein